MDHGVEPLQPAGRLSPFFFFHSRSVSEAICNLPFNAFAAKCVESRQPARSGLGGLDVCVID